MFVVSSGTGTAFHMLFQTDLMDVCSCYLVVIILRRLFRRSHGGSLLVSLSLSLSLTISEYPTQSVQVQPPSTQHQQDNFLLSIKQSYLVKHLGAIKEKNNLKLLNKKIYTRNWILKDELYMERVKVWDLNWKYFLIISTPVPVLSFLG